MGRRSDHTRSELRSLLVEQGHGLLAETGFARFSGREVAKRAGYSVGTIYNVFGSLDALLTAINSRTFLLWADFLHRRLAEAGEDRIRALVFAYFDFALAHPQLWSAIYEHRLSDDFELSEEDLADRSSLTAIVEHEVRAVLPEDCAVDAARLSRSLVATVHGHCSFAIGGTFALLDEANPRESALARVRESLAAHGYCAGGASAL